MTSEEISLIKKVIANDEQAFIEMFHIYYGKAYAIALRIMNNDADAQDAAQETMLEVHRSIHKLNEPSYFYAWMIRIVISKCNRMYRRKSATAMDPDKLTAIADYEEKRAYMLPEHASENAAERDILIALIYSLKKEMAVVLDMMYIQQMKLQEIADYLDIPINTVKTRAVRGRKLLKSEIKSFERLEGRKLSFHIHTPFIFTLLTYLSYSKKAVTHTGELMKTNAIQCVCAASFSALAVSGAVFIKDDINRSHSVNPPITTNENDEVKQTESSANPNAVYNRFQAVYYEDEIVETSFDAYYTCLNWAINEADMQNKSKEEIEAIRPIYEALKNKQDEYWQQLSNRGWVNAFEALSMK